MSNNRLIFFILIIIAIFITVSSVSAAEFNVTGADEISVDESPSLLRSLDDGSNYVEKNYDGTVLSVDGGNETFETHFISQNESFVYNEGGSLSVKLVDELNNTLGNQTVYAFENDILLENLTTDSNGNAIFEIDASKLPGEDYGIKFRFDETNSYKGCTALVKYAVTKIPTEIISSNVSAEYNSNTEFTVTLNDKYGHGIENEMITLKNIVPTLNEVTDSNGQCKFNTNGLPAGIYNATICFNGNDLYEKSLANISIVISKASSGQVSDPKNHTRNISLVYGGAKFFNVTLMDANGNALNDTIVTVNFNNQTFNKTTDKNGTVNVEIEGLKPQNYTATVTFEGNETLEKQTMVINIMIIKSPSKLIARGFTAYYPDGGYLNITLKDVFGNNITDADVNINLNNQTFKRTTDELGQIKFFANLSAEIYNVTVYYDGDDRYINSSTSAYINIKKTYTLLQASGFTTVYQDGKYLVVTLKDIDGNNIGNVNVTFRLNNETFVKTTNSSGQASLFVDLPPKQYNARIIFEGNDKYHNSYADANISVKRLGTTLNASGFTTVYGEGKYLVANLTDVNGNPIGNVSVYIRLDNETFNMTTDGNGQVSLFVDLLPKQYDAFIAFDGDERYINSYVNVPVVVNRLDTVLEASDVTTVYGEGKGLVATLKDVKGNAVENVTVSIRLNDETFNMTTDASGQVSLFVDLLPKYYHAAVVFAGDNRYNYSYTVANVTVNKLATVLNASGFTTVYGEGKYLVANLTDVNGNPIGNVSVYIGLDNETFNMTTDANGQVSLFVDLLAKQYNALVAFDGDERYINSHVIVPVVVNRLDTVLEASDVTTVYGEGKSLVATLKDVKGNAVENVTVSIRLNDETFNMTTDANGQVSLFVDLLPKYYHAAVVFAGDNGYGASYDNVNVTVNKLATVLNASGFDTVYGEGKNLVATLKDINGNAVENVNVSIKLDNVTYVKTTDASGQVSLFVDLLPKYYHAAVVFAGDNRYGASYDNVNVTVNKLGTVLNATGFTAYYGNPKNLTVTLKDINGNAVGNVNVSIKLVNATYVRTTDSNGQVSVLLDLLPKQYKAMISFDGDNRYAYSRTSANVIVNKVPAVMDASTVTTVYSDGEYIVASLKDVNGNSIQDTEVHIQVNNETYVRTTDNNGEVKVLVDLLPKQYNAVITIADDDRYTDSYITVPIVVKKLGTSVNATGFTTVYGKSKYVYATLVDEHGNALKNTNISVKFVSKTYVASTDENGQMKLLLNIVPKIYKAVVTFEGDDKYIKSTTTVNITVYKATPNLTAPKKSFKKSVKTKKYTVTLKTNLNKVMKNTKVTLKVNKKTYSAKTNSKGKATFKITNLKKKGTFKATVKYSGSKYYKAKSVTTKITVK